MGNITWVIIATFWFSFIVLIVLPILGIRLSDKSSKTFLGAIVLFGIAIFFDLLPQGFPRTDDIFLAATHAIKVFSFSLGLILFALTLFYMQTPKSD